MRALTLLYAFLGGAAVGAGAALLFAPEKVRNFAKKSNITSKNMVYANARSRKNLRNLSTKSPKK